MPSPRPRPLTEGWERELERLLLWDESLRLDADGLDLHAALRSCDLVRDQLGVSGEELEVRLRELLPIDASVDEEARRSLFAVRALLGLVDAGPTWGALVPGSRVPLRLGDVVLYRRKEDSSPTRYRADTVELLGYDFAHHLLARKAYVFKLFGLGDPTGIKKGSRATRLMVRALGDILGLSATSSQPTAPVVVRPHALLLQQLAVRVNEASIGYPRHLTPEVLIESLTLSSFTPTHADQASADRRGLYADVRSYGGSPANDVVARERRLVVLGNPGGGKSTVLCASVGAAAQRGAPAVLVRLSSFAERGGTPRTVHAALAVLFEIQSEDLGIPLPDGGGAAVAEALAAAPDALIALDGLDEVHAGDVEHVHNLLRLLADLPGRVVVSSRVAGYMTPPGRWVEVTVDALAPSDADGFIAAWFQAADEGAVRARAAIETESGRALAETPVLLGIIATVAEDNEVPSAVAQLYDRYVAHYLRGMWRHRSQWLPVGSIPVYLAAARSVAWTMATGGTGESDGVRWSDTVSYRALADIDRAEGEHGLTTVLAETQGLLVPHGRHRSELHQQYRWLHRTVHEHLVGGALADRVRRGSPLPDALLMGPTQWDLPLRHMIGLLDEGDARRVFAQMGDLRAGGDPGGVIDDVAQRMTYGLPPDSPILAERAQVMVERGDWRSAVELDRSILNDQYVTAIERCDEDALALQSYALRDHVPPKGVARRLVDALSAMRLSFEGYQRGYVDHAFDQAVGWLSRDEPDAALQALLAGAAVRYLDPPFLHWQRPPSTPVIANAVAEVARWEPMYRLRYLDFLAEIGADLTQFVAPAGPLRALDASMATALWNARRGRDAGDPSPYPLADDVIDGLLSGAYGDDTAYETAARDDLADRTTHASGTGPTLVRTVAALYTVEANAGPPTDPTPALQLLLALTLADCRDVVRLSAAMAAAQICLENAAQVPMELALRIRWNLSKFQHPARPTLFRPSLHWPLEAVADAFDALLASRGGELTEAIVHSDPAEWIVRPPAWADYSPVHALSKTGALDIENLLALTEWAAAAGGLLLRFVTRESITEAFVARLYAQAPQAAAVNAAEIADAMARLGRLTAWRERLIALADEPPTPSDA